jgi:probable HAF family extracellular repeat protein
MRTSTVHLPLVSMLLLAAACAEHPTISAPENASLTSITAAVEFSYDVIALKGGYGLARGINDAGIVAGMAREGSGEDPYLTLRWVVSSEGVTGPEDLGSLPPPFTNAFYHYPHAINESGQVVGFFNHNNSVLGGFVYSGASGMQPLPSFGGSTSWGANGVSDVGIVVGYVRYPVGAKNGTTVTRAAVWPNRDDEPILLPPLAGHRSSSAGSINTSGLVTGGSFPEEGSMVGVAWRVSAVGELLEGPYELEDGFSASALNNDGDMAGSYWGCQGALVRSGVVILLSSLASKECISVNDISNATADGKVWIVGSSGERPTLWTVDAAGHVVGPVDLGSASGKRSATANGVNVHGWVVGSGQTRHGVSVPLLWLPKAAGDDGGNDGGTCSHPRGKCK